MALAGVLRTSVAPRPWKGPRKPFWRIVAATQPDTVVNAAAPGRTPSSARMRGTARAGPRACRPAVRPQLPTECAASLPCAMHASQ